MANPHIYRWGLHDRLLDIAENYLGMATGYDGINIFFTKADGRETGFRRWLSDRQQRWAAAFLSAAMAAVGLISAGLVNSGVSNQDGLHRKFENIKAMLRQNALAHAVA
jgi:hypothetical protein